MRVVVVDDPFINIYSLPLYKKICLFLNKKKQIIFYASKDEWRRDTSYFQGRIIVKKMLNHTCFPFQVFKEAINDRADIVHMQFDFNVLFSPFTTFFIVLLCFFLLFSRAKKVITIHGVIPLDDRVKMFRSILPYELVAIPTVLIEIFSFFLYNSICVLSNAIIVHERYQKKDLIHFYKATPEKIHIIPHGVNNDQSVDPQLIEYWKKRTSGRKVILFFGSISPRKGLEYLLKAYSSLISKFPDYVLVISGRESPQYRSYVERIKNLAEQLRGHVVYTGFVGNEHVCALYSIAEFVVLPYVYHDAASGPLSLAIQFCKPVVASNVKTFLEELDHLKNAIIVASSDYVALRSGLEQIMSNDELRRYLSENIGQLSKQRDWTKVAHNTFMLYHNLMQKQR